MKDDEATEKAGAAIADLDDAVEEADWPRARSAWRSLEALIPGLLPRAKGQTERNLRETLDLRDAAQAQQSWQAAVTANRHLIELRTQLVEERRQAKVKRKPVSEMTREEFLAQQVDELDRQAEAVKGRDVQGHARIVSQMHAARAALDEERGKDRPPQTDAELEDLFVAGLAGLPPVVRARVYARVEARLKS